MQPFAINGSGVIDGQSYDFCLSAALAVPPRTVTNLIPLPNDFGGWGTFVSGDGAVSVVNGALTATVTASGRAFKTKSVTLEAGKTYKLTPIITASAGDVSYVASLTTGVTAGIPVVPAAAGYFANVGRMGQLFTCTTSGASTIWLGIGTAGVQNTPGSVTVAGIQLEVSSTNASEHVDGTATFNYAISNQGVAIGDSITLTGYYADQLMQRISTCSMVKKGVGGQPLPTIQSRFAADVVALAPRFVVIEGGINDIQLCSADPNTAMRAAVTSMVSQARSAGIALMVLGVGPFKGSTNWTADRQAWADSYNAWLLSWGLANDVPAVDVYALLNDGAQGLQPAFDSGDHLHPSTLAHRLIGNALVRYVGNGATVPI